MNSLGAAANLTYVTLVSLTTRPRVAKTATRSIYLQYLAGFAVTQNFYFYHKTFICMFHKLRKLILNKYLFFFGIIITRLHRIHRFRYKSEIGHFITEFFSDHDCISWWHVTISCEWSNKSFKNLLIVVINYFKHVKWMNDQPPKKKLCSVGI